MEILHRDNPFLALYWPCKGLQCVCFLKKQLRGGQKRHFIVWSGLRITEILLTNVLQQRNLDQISISMLATIAIDSDTVRYMGNISFIEKTGT